MRRIATLVGIALTFMTARAIGQEVSYDFDKRADFGAITTYAWAPGIGLEDELNHQRIVHAIDAQLAAKGLRQVGPDGDPDVVVAYQAGVRAEQEITGSGYGGYRPNRWGSARVEQVMVGVLVVDIVCTRTGNVVWRGVATRDIDVKAEPEKREKNIAKTAEKMFKHYPPTAEG